MDWQNLVADSENDLSLVDYLDATDELSHKIVDCLRLDLHLCFFEIYFLQD